LLAASIVRAQQPRDSHLHTRRRENIKSLSNFLSIFIARKFIIRLDRPLRILEYHRTKIIVPKPKNICF
jgi:hypothetical protein